MPKGRAADWYPDIQEAAEWRRYSQLVFDDFWRAKDAPQNDTGYMMGPIIILACGGDQWTGDDRVYLDPNMQSIWERLLVEISPDGLINTLRPERRAGTAQADYRVAILELLSAKTRDGRYRFGAHRLMNYLRYQSHDFGQQNPRMDSGGILAHRACIHLGRMIGSSPRCPPPTPFGTSAEKQYVFPHTDKELTDRLLG